MEKKPREIEFPAEKILEEYGGQPQQQPHRVILLGLELPAYDAQRSMDELAALAEANDMLPVAEVLQKRAAPDPATALGAGRLAEAKLLASNLEALTAVFDGELSGSQLRNMEEALNIPVIDRTMLILSIFSSRAVSREGKIQTELALQEYRLPRLAGLGASLSRQGGGSAGGTGARRGGGETKLEYDRRYVRRRISQLKKRLAAMQAQREENRRSRERSGVPVVALVGYTNVGKSSLVNTLAGSDIVAKDMLFATLDPSARQLKLPAGQTIVLVDTVGFVSRLPHNLVEAFKSTLEEAARADLLLKVCDASDTEAYNQLQVTDQVLGELGAGGIDQIIVYNKCDKVADFTLFDASGIAVSAKTGQGMEELTAAIEAKLARHMRQVRLLLPYEKLALADLLRKRGSVQKEEYREDGVYYEASVEAAAVSQLQPYFFRE